MANKKECTVYQEPQYKIAKKENGDIIIVISKYIGKPSNPEIIYNGSEHALLYRDEQTAVLLSYINPAFRKDLLKAKSVLVVELEDIINTENVKISQDYKAIITVVNQLPVPEDKIITPQKLEKQISNKKIA